jgi:putative membrane protein
MKSLIIRWAILAAAIAATAWLLPGVMVQGSGTQYLINLFVIAAVLGLVNAIIRPIVMLLTCPLVILTLGLFSLVVNALMLSLVDWLLPSILTVDGIWTTFFASLIIAIIAGLLSVFVSD